MWSKLENLSFWQSSLWANILESSGFVRETLRIDGILIEVRSIGLWQFGAFSLGILRDIDPDAILRIQSDLRARGVLYWQREYLDGLSEPQVHSGRIFLEPYTALLDLSLTPDDLLARMHEKCRYNIRLAQKRGVTTEWVQGTPEHIDTWMRLLSETTERDGFAHNTRSYYEAFLRYLEESGAGGLQFARYQDEVIAAGIWVYQWDRAIYYYGASTSDPVMRKHMAPYLLQWEAILEAKRRSLSVYDFLGVAPPGVLWHHLAGVTAFKEKFGSEIAPVGKKELDVFSIKGQIFLILKKIRDRIGL